MKKILAISAAVLFVAAGCSQQPAQQQSTIIGTPGQISSITLEPSYNNANWTMYSDGAVVKVMGKNLQNVEIKYNPTGTNQSTRSLGEATSLSSQQGAWALPMPKGIMATSVWAEAKDEQGNTVKSQDLGNVDYESLNSYKSPTKYGFSVQYPNDFGFNTDIKKVRSQVTAYIPPCDENTLGCVFYSGDEYKGTNFESAGVSVAILPADKIGSNCLTLGTAEPSNVVINGVTFVYAEEGNAATGHFAKDKIYRAIHNNQCYQITARVGSTNIANYPSGTIKEFNQDEVWNRLQYVVDTFRFTDQSATAPSNGSSVTVTGTTVCLPHKNVKPGQPQTLECAIGLKDSATGKYYGLKNSPTPINDVNVKLQVTGTLVSAAQSNYDVVGDIEVQNTKLLK